ncbi:hypothetical protein DYB32_009819 [Aphanomyces invadans]|uniref:MULE transposase domain-containing protein n=1 Tax=Aphanomyces invadans TaxID=157072 RepID=A0A418AHP8_9STRA|nr:hypothetical protein DYB32_009819 [Aphanomyces invadans]
MCTRYMDCLCRGQNNLSKRIKVVECLLNGECVAFKSGEYGECAPPNSRAMTRSIRNAADRLFAEGCTPSQAQHSLKQMIPAAAMPPLKHFQNRARYFGALQLHENSHPAEMVKLLMKSRFVDAVPENEFSSFGYDLVDNTPQIGFGGDSGVFKVGITTKTLLQQMDATPSTFVFHWDATYKINSLAYPILICGITDPSGQFHPVAFFVIGKETTKEYEWAMKELVQVYKAVVGKDLLLDFVMADAATTPIAAVKSFPSLNVSQTSCVFTIAWHA